MGVAYLLGILYFCLPPPERFGLLVDGTLARCQAPMELRAESIRYWNDRIAGAPWARVRAGWQDELAGMIAREPGVVLTIDVRRENPVIRHRKPWNRGRLEATGWHAPAEPVQRFYASFAGAACAGYTSLPLLYMSYGQSSKTWPPDDVANFLDLMRIDRAEGRAPDIREE